MIGLEVVLTLLIVRLILPFGLILLIGEILHRREAKYWLRM